MNGVLTRTTTRRAFRWTRPQWTGRCDLPVGRVHGTNAGECLRRESGDETAQSAGAGHERARPSVGRTGVTCCGTVYGFTVQLCMWRAVCRAVEYGVLVESWYEKESATTRSELCLT